MTIFISHSSKNKSIAEAFQYLLCEYLDISPKDIFCTAGIGLRIGDKIGDTIKDKLAKTTCFFALITKESLGSSWVLMEIGYAWIDGKKVMPILLGNLDVNDLPSPLRDIQVGKLKNDSSVKDEVEKIIESITEPVERGFKRKNNVPTKKKTNWLKALEDSIKDYNNKNIGTSLSVGEYLLTLEQAGNLVLYKGGQQLWQAQTGKPKREARVAIMQEDGNFCLYNKKYQDDDLMGRADSKHAANCIWASDTYNSPNAYLRLDINGYLAIVDQNHDCIKMLFAANKEDSYKANVQNIALYPRNTMELPNV